MFVTDRKARGPQSEHCSANVQIKLCFAVDGDEGDLSLGLALRRARYEHNPRPLIHLQHTGASGYEYDQAPPIS